MSASELALALTQARTEARRIPASSAISDLTAAYRIQTELADLSPGGVGGWKVSALTADAQKKFGGTKPVAGILLAVHFYKAPTSVKLDRLIAPLLECEVAFVLGADLPPRAAPYQASEVAAAIAEVVPVMEIVDSRIPPEASDYLRLADAMANGAFVTGTPLKNWQAFDLDHLAITLAFDTALTEEGNSDRIPGGPFGAVVAIANAQPLPAGGLKRGQIVTTGTCTTPAEITKGTYLADFGPLGTVQASFI